jgi:hypothetical protein
MPGLPNSILRPLKASRCVIRISCLDIIVAAWLSMHPGLRFRRICVDPSRRVFAAPPWEYFSRTLSASVQGTAFPPPSMYVVCTRDLWGMPRLVEVIASRNFSVPSYTLLVIAEAIIFTARSAAHFLLVPDCEPDLLDHLPQFQVFLAAARH